VTFKSTIGFVLGALGAAAIGAVALYFAFRNADRLASGWAAKGFLAMALPGIAGGAWLAREHGRSAARFLAALATGFITRLVLAALAAFFAARAGDGAGTALLSGLAAGFVPLMIFEMTWFVRSRGVQGLGAGSRG
jgi:hypothetical protein